MSSRNSDLHGNISTEKKTLSGAVHTEEKTLRGEFTPHTEVFSGVMASGGRVLSGQIFPDDPLRGNLPGTLELHYSPDAVPEYKGSYEVTPDLNAQTLETAGQLMREDVTIKPIPIYEVSNNGGGTTVIIGG